MDPNQDNMAKFFNDTFDKISQQLTDNCTQIQNRLDSLDKATDALEDICNISGKILSVLDRAEPENTEENKSNEDLDSSFVLVTENLEKMTLEEATVHPLKDISNKRSFYQEMRVAVKDMKLLTKAGKDFVYREFLSDEDNAGNLKQNEVDTDDLKENEAVASSSKTPQKK